MMNYTKTEIKNSIIDLKKQAKETLFKKVIVEENQVLQITSLNNHFQSLTLNDGSIVELMNSQNVESPIILIIDNLIINSVNKPSTLSFFRQASYSINGDHGAKGPKTQDGYRYGRRSRYAKAPSPGKMGGYGENGSSITTRGILHLWIKKIYVKNGEYITKDYFTIDGKGWNGGKGGNGGTGGNGGEGAPGRTGKHDCNYYKCWCSRAVLSGTPGAIGGLGGIPGKGGAGGSGATILLYGKRWIFKALSPLINVEAGLGGKGGKGGAGGKGGTGAASVHGGGGHCGRRHPKEADGTTGIDRRSIIGGSGIKGTKGIIKRTRKEPTYDTAISELLEQLDSKKGIFRRIKFIDE